MKRSEDISVREGYDRWAELYDHDGNPLVALDERVTPRLLGAVAGLDVLELGCGTGRHTARLVDAGAHVTALDFSAGMLEKARARLAGREVSFVEADLTRPLGASDASFDLVLSCLALEHVEHLEPLFVEVHRVLKRGGAFVCSDMHPAMRLRGIQASFDAADGTQVRVEGYAHPVSSYVMAALEAGFSIEHLAEHAGSEDLMQSSARAAKYVGYPMLLVMRATKPS